MAGRSQWTRRLDKPEPSRLFFETRPILGRSSISEAMLHILWSIILGFIAGFVAKHLLGAHLGFIATTLLGIAGSIVGGLIARLFSKPTPGQVVHPAGLILSIIGAILTLWIVGMFT
jgi:uncharacterized membrane protein YeaQ/YmgE (transglycosylase-associated protein family)